MSSITHNSNTMNSDDSIPPFIYARIADNRPMGTTLAHSLNSRGELGLYVNPHGCPCQTCQDYLAARATEPPGLSNLTPPNHGIPLERQIGVASGSPDRTPPSLPISPSALLQRNISVPLNLPVRSDCHGIPPPTPRPTIQRSASNWTPTMMSLGPSDTNWAPAMSVAPTESHTRLDDHPSLCTCGPCTGTHENTGMPLELHKQISEHLRAYLALLEKQQDVLNAKLALYAELLDDASPRLRANNLSQKIQKLKITLAMLG